MPDRPLTIATYAAGASLAAITLVYVFGPTFFLDDEASNSTRSSRTKGVVGLVNPANDCFINSVLQALAGLPDLRLYLIRELHRRQLDGSEVYEVEGHPAKGLAEQNKSKDGGVPPWKLGGLQQGLVTRALKDVLDRLNERPIYKKTISAQDFVLVLERAFRTRISRQQQDAQEFLQVVTERLCDEYHAGKKARRKAKRLRRESVGVEVLVQELEKSEETIKARKIEGSVPEPVEDEREAEDASDEDTEDGFPFEGKLESQIECLTCHFKPKPSVSSFVTLTLNVPQKPSTSLNSCFDGMLKVEHIEDFKCDNCRLLHALESKQKQLSSPSLPADIRHALESDISKIRTALTSDPEKPPADASLPDIKLAPKRRIARHMRISSFPKILAIHLSRSIFDGSSLSTKNMAKVAFPETLPLGGILDQKQYKLLGVVTHKGGHNSGHYESFRRQVANLPYSTPHSFGTEGVYSQSERASPSPSLQPSPRLDPRGEKEATTATATATEVGRASEASTLPPSLPSPSPSAKFSLSSSHSHSHSRSSTSSPLNPFPPPTSAPHPSSSTTAATNSNATSNPRRAPSLSLSLSKRPPSLADLSRLKHRKKRPAEARWWRISDERVRESKTVEVLGMRREVYLLFYEWVREAV
ncbi:hypothetical protein BJ546DRAFT_686501 [Cryomyces antarcticus]